ncbi:cyclic nucleotide-gated ion channel [Taklimakanibacter albus]|uniref:Ion transporter n=1 Tax=Taklimakanibacter albus TaxID=2800327 RepID=A0ACC5QY11_9HYPH|nr:cyclic nucleotide-gated ion channel [Aestuariivirga sp. YIM B02566]MBK1865276.1 ion transporter [Aestuariivirga sp. YIM B02566]
MAQVSARRRAYEIIEPGIKRDRLALWFERASILIILASVAGAVSSTVPGLDPDELEGLWLGELVCGLFFLLEYAARLWTAAEHPVFGGANGRGLIAYVTSPLMLLDAAGLVPLFLLALRPQAQGAMLIFQVLRFFRLARYSPALATVGRVLTNEWRPLMAAGLIGLGLLLVAATGMYLIEHDVQPTSFGSIPAAMYWAVVTVVTVGYGDVVPITAWGKLFTGFVMLGGLIFFALPVAIIATGFLAEIRRRDFIVNYGMVARVPAFTGLDGAALAELVSLLRARKFPPNTIIIRKGDEGDSMYFIASGEVEVVLPHQSVALQEGDFFGEVAVLGRVKRMATVIARRTSELLVLDAADVVKFMEQNPRVEAVLRAAMTARQKIQEDEPA